MSPRVRLVAGLLLLVSIKNSCAKESYFSDVSIAILHPKEGDMVSCPFAPSVDVSIAGSGPYADRIKNGLENWVLCTAVDADPPRCKSITSGDSVPLVGTLSPRNAHKFSAFLANADGNETLGYISTYFTVPPRRVPRCNFLVESRGYNELREYFDNSAIGASINVNPTFGPVPVRGDLSWIPKIVWLDERSTEASHQVILAHFVLESIGDVLEFGTSVASTPLLRALVGGTSRRLVSIDDSASAIDAAQQHFAINANHAYENIRRSDFEDKHRGLHWVKYLERGLWKKAAPGDIGVVFANQRSFEGRRATVEIFLNVAKYVVLHDVAMPSKTEASFWNMARHVRVYESSRCSGGPLTAVMSNELSANFPGPEQIEHPR